MAGWAAKEPFNHLRVVCVGSALAEEDPAALQLRRRALQQSSRQLLDHRHAAVGEAVIEAEPAHLVGRRLHQFLVSPPQSGAPQARHGLDVLLAVVVNHVDAVPAHQPERRHTVRRGEIGHGS